MIGVIFKLAAFVIFGYLLGSKWLRYSFGMPDQKSRSLGILLFIAGGLGLSVVVLLWMQPDFATLVK